MSNEIISSLCAGIARLRTMRYPTMVVVLEEQTPVTADVLRQAADGSGLRLIDYRTDVLESGTPGIILGAYRRDQFNEWLRETARDSGGILVTQADELISSWRDCDRRDFLVEFLHTESNQSDGLTRAPIVLATRHASDFSLPHSERGQGLVWMPETP